MTEPVAGDGSDGSLDMDTMMETWLATGKYEIISLRDTLTASLQTHLLMTTAAPVRNRLTHLLPALAGVPADRDGSLSITLRAAWQQANSRCTRRTMTALRRYSCLAGLHMGQ